VNQSIIVCSTVVGQCCEGDLCLLELVQSSKTYIQWLLLPCFGNWVPPRRLQQVDCGRLL